MPFLSPFLIVEDGTENNLIDPTNVPVERSFGMFKFLEKLLVNLQFGLLSAMTLAKFNHLNEQLQSFDSDKLWNAHAEIDSIEARMRKEHEAQEANRVEHTERVRDEVHMNRTCVHVLILSLGELNCRAITRGI